MHQSNQKLEGHVSENLTSMADLAHPRQLFVQSNTDKKISGLMRKRDRVEINGSRSYVRSRQYHSVPYDRGANADGREFVLRLSTDREMMVNALVLGRTLHLCQSSYYQVLRKHT